MGGAFKEFWFRNPWLSQLHQTKSDGSEWNERSNIIQMRVKVKGAFAQRFRLEHFPFDVQALAVRVVCTDHARHIRMVEKLATDGPDGISQHILKSGDGPLQTSDGHFGLRTDGFPWETLATSSHERATAEYDVLPMVRAEYSVKGVRARYSEHKRNGELVFYIWVRRSSRFFLWNYCGVVFLLVSTGWTAMCVPVPQTGDRLAIICTLLLTCVNYKANASAFLARLHYNTCERHREAHSPPGSRRVRRVGR